MTRRNPPAKWTLPNVVNPSTSVCYTIPVPNERFHIGAFLGALQNLGSAAQWADDEAHTAKDVAQVWRAIIDELEKEVCSGCKHTNGEFLPPLEAGETKMLSVTVEAGEFQILPILLLPNQSITISNMVGQWRDSTYHPDEECVSNWETPLGVIIAAGGVFTAETFVTDVMPEISHMKLIMRINACDVLSYHDLDDPITYTVPGSAPSAGVFVEFLGNCPVDGTNEIAAGFLGYGMVCFKAIVSDPNLCEQVFIDFESGSLGLFDLITGSIVSSSPIGDGAALENGEPQVISAQSIIEVPFDGCAVRDVAFTIYPELTGSSGDLQVQLVAYNEADQVIDNYDEELSLVDLSSQNFTITPVTVPGVFKLRIAWTIISAPNDQPTFYIDNVYVN